MFVQCLIIANITAIAGVTTTSQKLLDVWFSFQHHYGDRYIVAFIMLLSDMVRFLS